MKWRLELMGAVVLLLVATAAWADSPQSTTATYENWVVRCHVLKAGNVCEMTQTTQVKGGSQPVTQIAIGHGKDGGLVIVVQVPVNVWLSSGVKLVTDDKQTAVSASFKRCVPQGCFAETALGDDAIKTLRAQTNNGVLQFANAAQQEVDIPVSFKGFDAAYDSIKK